MPGESDHELAARASPVLRRDCGYAIAMTDQKRSALLGVAQPLWMAVLLAVVLTQPKHHPSALWIGADIAVVLVLLAINAALFVVRKREMERRARVFDLRKSALVPVLILVLAAFVVQRLLG